MRLLVVDDDRALRDVLRRALSLAGYEVLLTESGAGALSEINTGLPDAVVLDVGLPDIDGLEVCRLLRREGNRVPVLMLTARDAVADRIDGLDAGADDYLVKPFALTELIARVRVLVRRAQARLGETLTLGKLKMDLDAKRAYIAEAPLELSAREWSVLEFLLARADKVVAKEQILQAIAGWDESISENAIEVYVSRLRSKIETAGVRIRTVRGFGYMLEDAAHATDR